MLKLRKSQVDANRLDLEFSGKIDSAEMQAFVAEFVSQAESIEKGKMLYRIHDFDIPSMGALMVELSHLASLFRAVQHFERVAVLADEKWIRKMSELEGKLFPHIEIKAFLPENEANAEAWLAG